MNQDLEIKPRELHSLLEPQTTWLCNLEINTPNIQDFPPHKMIYVQNMQLAKPLEYTTYYYLSYFELIIKGGVGETKVEVRVTNLWA